MMATANPPTIAPMIDLADRVADVPGDFIEFGVFRARSFAMLLPHAIRQGKIMHGVDSFAGMDTPGPHDLTPDGNDPYPRGRFANGGIDAIRGLLSEFKPASYRLHQGYVPAILGNLDIPALSFAFLDLDHYEPTRAAIGWAWDRLSPGGIMVCDDFVVGTDCLATRAISEFIERDNPRIVRINLHRVAFLRS